MKKERTFVQEARAMEKTIADMYREREYLESRIKGDLGDTERDRIRLQMVEHFIRFYEEY